MSDPRPPVQQMSRRGLLGTVGAVGLGTLLTACGGDPTGTGDDPAGGDTAWSFTDDRKKKVTADTRPKRIVAYVGSTAALHHLGLGARIVGVFGPAQLKNGKPDPEAGDLDLDTVKLLGNVYGEFNVEQYAALRPDLLVTHMFEPPALWFVPDKTKDKIGQVAPSVGITVSGVSLTEPVKRYAQLARSLGADLTDTRVTDAKKRFDQATDRLRKAVKANPGVRVMAASASSDMLYVSDPKVYADLSYYRDLGLEIVTPGHVTDGYYESLSWENASKYQADVILLDSRSSALQPDDLTSKPTWTRLPAVRAGQIVPWPSVPHCSYAGSAPHIETLATAIHDAKKVS